MDVSWCIGGNHALHMQQLLQKVDIVFVVFYSCFFFAFWLDRCRPATSIHKEATIKHIRSGVVCRRPPLNRIPPTGAGRVGYHTIFVTAFPFPQKSLTRRVHVLPWTVPSNWGVRPCLPWAKPSRPTQNRWSRATLPWNKCSSASGLERWVDEVDELDEIDVCVFFWGGLFSGQHLCFILERASVERMCYLSHECWGKAVGGRVEVLKSSDWNPCIECLLIHRLHCVSLLFRD